MSGCEVSLSAFSLYDKHRALILAGPSTVMSTELVLLHVMVVMDVVVPLLVRHLININLFSFLLCQFYHMEL